MLFTTLNQGKYPLYQIIVAVARLFGVGSMNTERISYLRVVSDSAFQKMFGYKLPHGMHTAVLLATSNGKGWMSSPILVSFGGETNRGNVLSFGCGMKLNGKIASAYKAAADGDPVTLFVDTASHKSVGKDTVACVEKMTVQSARGIGRSDSENSWWNSSPTLFSNNVYGTAQMPDDDILFAKSAGSGERKNVHFIVDATPDVLCGGAPITIVPCFVIHTKEARRYAFIRGNEMPNLLADTMWRYRSVRRGYRGSRAIYRNPRLDDVGIVNMGLPSISAVGMDLLESRTSDGILGDHIKKSMKSGDKYGTRKTEKKVDPSIAW